DLQVHGTVAAVQLREYPAQTRARGTALGASGSGPCRPLADAAESLEPGAESPTLMSIPALGLDTFLGWIFRTISTAAEAEMNDDSVLREQLLEAEMRREIGEISDEEFAEVEADLLQRIREIKERREGGAGPLEFGAEAVEKGEDERFQIEATISGDF